MSKGAFDTAADFAERLEMSFGQSEEMEKFMIMYAEEKTAELNTELERLKEKRHHTLVTVNGFLDVISANHSVSLSNHIGGATRAALSQVICAINE